MYFSTIVENLQDLITRHKKIEEKLYKYLHAEKVNKIMFKSKFWSEMEPRDANIRITEA